MRKSTSLLSEDRLREVEMAEAQEEVSSVVVLFHVVSVCAREEAMGEVSQLCEDAVESCTGPAGCCEGDPWDFGLD